MRTMPHLPTFPWKETTTLIWSPIQVPDWPSAACTYIPWMVVNLLPLPMLHLLLGLTFVIYEELAPCCLAVRTRLVSPILLYALTTEELATGLMLSWVSTHRQADQTLEGVSWFRHKVAIITFSTGHFCNSKLLYSSS